MTIPIINVVSYSYKGGSGRSTGSVNIAFQLARAGKLVVCLDMDIGAAGLHMIMSEWQERARAKITANVDEVGHQAFFNTKDPARADFAKLSPAMLDIVSEVPGYITGGGNLLFLFSGTRTRALNDLSGGPQSAKVFEEKYHFLQQLLAEKIGGSDQREVYVIVDSPNGITSVSLPLLKSADLILMFYRHSLQHIHGTIEAGRKLYYYLMEELDRRYMRILLVGSCVPERLIGNIMRAEETARFEEKDYGHDMADQFKRMKKDLEDFVRRYPDVIVPLKEQIIEDDVLKVLEQPLTSDGVRNAYLGYPDGWEEWSSKETRDKIGKISAEIARYGPEVVRRKNRMYGI